MAVIAVSLPESVDEPALQIACAQALVLACNTCVAEDVSDGKYPESVYLHFDVTQDLPWHDCLKIGAQSRFTLHRKTHFIAAGNELSHQEALAIVREYCWDRIVRAIVGGLVVAAGETNLGTQKTEQLQLDVGVYMYDKVFKRFVQRFVSVELADYNIKVAPV